MELPAVGSDFRPEQLYSYTGTLCLRLCFRPGVFCTGLQKLMAAMHGDFVMCSIPGV